MVAKFLSPDSEIVSRFGDCLPFGDMSLAVLNGLDKKGATKRAAISLHQLADRYRNGSSDLEFF